MLLAGVGRTLQLAQAYPRTGSTWFQQTFAEAPRTARSTVSRHRAPPWLKQPQQGRAAAASPPLPWTL